MAGKKGSYSDIVIYDSRRRYYYMWAQKNRPLLDDEVRNMGVSLLDQVRRSVQRIYGDVAAPYSEYSGFSSTTEAFKVKESTSPSKNFTVTGGTSINHPAALYANGFYIFITGDIDYRDQMYTSPNIDLNTESDKYKTITPIPSLTTPVTDRTDIVYVHLHFEEVSAATGTDTDVYIDSGLKNPIVGNETANRLRAVIDIRVREGWTSTIDKDIFIDNEFLGSISPNDTNPVNDEYKIPIAVIYRKAFQDTIADDDIVDLLSLYNKRVFSLEEVAHRMRHGGYTQADVDELGLTGFQPQFPDAKIDEGAFATGLNEGLGTEAFNSNSVTPRVLDNDGKFIMDGLMIGHDTGLIALETGPEGLEDGELIAQKASVRSLYAGHGLSGIPGAREYKDVINAVGRGETGVAIMSITNYDGETGSQTATIAAKDDDQILNFFHMDYRGRVGLNTFEPGWEQPDPMWNTDRYNDGLFGETGVNVLMDVNGSVRVRDHAFIDKDVYVGGNAYGKTWQVPGELSEMDPALFGFTGLPHRFAGFTGHAGLALFKRGVAVVGETGTEAYGYTGAVGGQYECYDMYGRRMFTIGDLGEEFDRVVKTLYGTGVRRAFQSDYSFLYLPSGYGEVKAGDVVTYSLILETGEVVDGSLTLTQTGMDGVEEIKADILANPDFANGYSRTFNYEFHEPSPPNPPGTVTIKSGTAEGVQIIEDPYGAVLGFDNHGRITLKDMPESPVEVEIREISSFTVKRGIQPTLSIPFTFFHWYGSTQYGGDLANVKFAKLDLGEGADAWLFNGDVFFNGNGLQNRVTFSPNVIFRDDVFMYGTLYADSLLFNFANVGNLVVRNTLKALGYLEVTEGLALGENSLSSLSAAQGDDPELLLYNKGNARHKGMVLEGEDLDVNRLGSLFFKGKYNNGRQYVHFGGDINGTNVPFGIHLIDRINPIDGDNAFNDLVLDYSDGNGNYGNLNLIITGNVRTNRGLIARNLAVGNVTSINSTYAFDCQGRARINDILEVKGIEFIGAEAPETVTEITTPQNVVVVDNNSEETQNKDFILRNKDFTITERVYLNNNNNLGTTPNQTDPGDYYDFIKGFTGPPQANWAHDSLTYTESEFDALVESGDPGATQNEIVVQELTTESEKRYSFDRVIVATLGTLNIEWSGYKYDPDNLTTDVIQSYYFESPYFRNRNGGTVINWMPGETRFGDDNLLVRVTCDLVDTNTSAPTIFNLDAPLGVYVPINSWFQYAPNADSSTGYRSFVVFNPYENALQNLNITNFIKRTDLCGQFSNQSWKMAMYPRLIRQTRVPFDPEVQSNQDRMYQGQWNIDVVLFPPAIGRCANMVGKLYISFMQS